MNIIHLAGWSCSFMAILILQANALCLGLPAAQSSVFRSCLGHTHYSIVILMQQLLPKLLTYLYTHILIWLLLVSAIFTQWVQSEVIYHVNPKVRSVSFFAQENVYSDICLPQSCYHHLRTFLWVSHLRSADQCLQSLTAAVRHPEQWVNQAYTQAVIRAFNWWHFSLEKGNWFLH